MVDIPRISTRQKLVDERGHMTREFERFVLQTRTAIIELTDMVAKLEARLKEVE